MSKISLYPDATTPLTGTEVLIGNQGGVTKKITAQSVAALSPPTDITGKENIGVAGGLITTHESTFAHANIATAYTHSQSAHAPSTAEQNVQADWNQSSIGSDDYIKNKPESLPASDVSAWAKTSVKPTYTATEVSAEPTLTTAIADTSPLDTDEIISMRSGTKRTTWTNIKTFLSLTYFRLTQLTDSSATTNILINPSTKTSGNLFDAQTGGVSKVKIDSNGVLSQQTTVANESAPLGVELNDGTGWVLTAGWTGDNTIGFSHSAGTTVLTRTMTTINAQRYQVSYTVTGMTLGYFYITFGGINTPQNITANGSYSFGPTTVNTTNFIIYTSTDFNGTISNISIKTITGAYNPIYVLLDSAAVSTLEVRNSSNTLSNTFIGKNTGRYNTTGASNTVIGVSNLQNNTTGASNTVIGVSNLSVNTVGIGNIAIGAYNLQANSGGNYSIAIGSNSLQTSVSNGSNIAIGFYSLQANTSGINNIALGSSSGRTLTTGNNNVFIGMNAGYNGSQLVSAINSTAIGNGAYTTSSNQVVIGNGSVTQTILNGAVEIKSGGISKAITTTATNLTLSSIHHTITVTADCIITLPAVASNSGRIYVIKKTYAAGTGVVIDGNSSETLDGALTQTLTAQYQSITIQSDGLGWWII